MARNAIMRKSYVYADGTTSRSAKNDWTALRFEFFDGVGSDGKPAVANTVDFSRGDFEKVSGAAMGHGLAQKLGDEAAGYPAKAEKAHATADWQFVKSLITDAADNLRNGVWVEEGEGSSGAGNVTILAEATARAYAEIGKPLSDGAKAKVISALANKEEREKARANALIAKHVRAIEKERADERARKAAEVDTTDAGAALGGMFALEDAGDE